MKTLYLHCGYHKTGSSFLQMLFARNRELLEKNSIHYPLSERELDMLEGNISPGNGLALSDSLIAQDPDITNKILTGGIEEARKKECDAVLYSSESFFHAFAKENALTRLCGAAEKAGFQNIEALVYFRDPASHALSLYKHRAKRGDHADFKEWISQKYETMGLIASFNAYHTEYPIQWSCRKYRPDSTFMAESAFKDWLGLEIPQIPEDDKVNMSLSLSEIRIIQILKDNFGAAVPFLQKEFGQLSKTEKSSDKSLDSTYQAVASNELAKHRDVIAGVNRLLPESEDLIDVKVEKEEARNLLDELPITLTPKQVQAIAFGMLKALNSQKIINVAGNFWNKGVSKVKRKLKANGF